MTDNRMSGGICLRDISTTHSILLRYEYISCLTLCIRDDMNIIGMANMIEHTKCVTLLLYNGTIHGI
ncbi:hypothetical protein GIB67_015199 [Kingdonia uniflora]|uniref:Uncharacterized protein n=1 Tax=Kingdonia uniflora TaxID=39325 RepID=A0A7J7MSP1_9MAGN|nr:hypothetical protein GIB67_015199 [Kingdonia uniflora]